MKVEEIGSHGTGSFADLPMEIIFKIFRYLNFRDIQSMSLVCRWWLEASQVLEFHSKMLLKFTRTHLSDDSFPGSVFLNTFRSFPHICLHKITLGVVNKLFTHIGSTVEHIVFDKVNITEQQFSAILKKTPNLKALSVIGPLSLSKQIFISEAGQELLAASLRNIREITIKKNRHLTDAILPLLTSLPPNLEQINIDSVSSFKILLNVIENHVTTLKELCLSVTDHDDDYDCSSLANIKGLDLQKIGFVNCSIFKFTGLETLLKSQKNLVELDLSRTTISDSCIELIYNHLTKLEILKLKMCGKISSANMVGVSVLKKLKVLDISYCDISSDGIQQGIAKAKNIGLLELYMSANCELSEACFIQCAENFPNLRVFDISFCATGVTDKVIQAIIKNLTWLNFINLNGCTSITDAGLTGINVEAQLSNKSDLSPSSSNEEYEINQLNGRIQDGLSIKELKRLKTLELEWCNKITDASLIYGLQFLELKCLNLGSCQQISFTGIQALVENCPSIEVLNLSFCRNINKECIEVISQRLQRLQILDIGVCMQLYDHFEYVVTNCKALRIVTHPSGNGDRAIQKTRQYRNLCTEDYCDIFNELSSE